MTEKLVPKPKYREVIGEVIVQFWTNDCGKWFWRVSEDTPSPIDRSCSYVPRVSLKATIDECRSLFLKEGTPTGSTTPVHESNLPSPPLSEESLQKSMGGIEEKIETVFNHIRNVQRSTHKLGLKLIKEGEIELGRNLISNGQIHDNSKFKGIEFEHLFYGDPLLPEVIKHHQSINPHHPEYWGSIHEMPRVYVAEMVCDWYARSCEFGTSVRSWVSDEAAAKFNFTQEDKIYKTIQEMLGLLLDKKF